MAASVHRLQLVHSATSMIMFHFFIEATLYHASSPGVSRRSRSVATRTALSFRRQQVRFLERAFDFLVLLRGSKSRRHMLGAAIPKFDLDQRIGAGKRVGVFGLRTLGREQIKTAAAID